MLTVMSPDALTMVHVDLAPDGRVLMKVESIPFETFEDKDVVRVMSPKVARELAAALIHAAREADRQT